MVKYRNGLKYIDKNMFFTQNISVLVLKIIHKYYILEGIVMELHEKELDAVSGGAQIVEIKDEKGFF